MVGESTRILDRLGGEGTYRDGVLSETSWPRLLPGALRTHACRRMGSGAGMYCMFQMNFRLR